MAKPRYVRYRKFNRLQHSTHFLKWLDAVADNLSTTAKFVFEVLLVDHKMTFEQVQQIDALTAPENISIPVIIGDAIVDAVLYAEPGEWGGVLAPAFTYQWFRDSGTAEEIEDATSSTYTVTEDDIGATLFVRVTATNEIGSDAEDSAPTDAVVALSAPVNAVAPAITGAAEVGSKLEVVAGTWTGFPEPELTYQWFQAGGDETVEIEGAKGDTYTVTEGDVGLMIFVRETATNSQGSDSVDSELTATVTEFE